MMGTDDYERGSLIVDVIEADDMALVRSAVSRPRRRDEGAAQQEARWKVHTNRCVIRQHRDPSHRLSHHQSLR
jgi:hypothetical protein